MTRACTTRTRSSRWSSTCRRLAKKNNANAKKKKRKRKKGEKKGKKKKKERKEKKERKKKETPGSFDVGALLL